MRSSCSRSKLVAALAISLAGTFAVSGADVVSGVSAELARERKACLDSVRYNIAFFYPSQNNPQYRIEEEIRFLYAGGLEECLQIDFDGSSVEACTVNGVAIVPEWKANHILIPQQLLRRGHNSIRTESRGSGKALNHNPDYLYTLFVPANAHSVFPCFDQPDMKGRFRVTLHIPQDYKCLSTMDIESVFQSETPGYKAVEFQESAPLPTYLMSWVIGNFRQAEANGMTVLHKETDLLKVAQIPELARMSSQAIRWLEDYTALPYPYGKYDFAIIPGFQFGGMEHPGAILYPPETTFLSQTPTPEELLWRLELIAHETSHIWFGDLVTMRWFDDVWTKEVFANFMASKISSDTYPDIDHNFNFIRGNYQGAYFTDRTDGTHPIAQNLDNLKDAGLVYGNIIYYKAPIMMRMLERRVGEGRLRDGLRAYLKKYAMANSSWDELIELLDSVAPDADVKGFSEAWVKRKGMPCISAGYDPANRRLTVTQADPTGAGTIWPQTFSVRLIGTKGCRDITVDLFEKEWSAVVDTAGLGAITTVLPNSHGDGYGYFKIDDPNTYLHHWSTLEDDCRYAAILNLANAWAAKDWDSGVIGDLISSLLPLTNNPLVAGVSTDLLATMAAQDEIGEDMLWKAYGLSPHPSVKQRLLRSIYSQCVGMPSAHRLYGIWESQGDSLMNQRDYMTMACRLAVLLPHKAADIIATQRQRLADNPNLTREFDFVSRGCSMETDQLLAMLSNADNRLPEPWTAKELALAFDPARQNTDAQMKRALDMLPEIQATGGIFFPTKWAKAVVDGARSPESKRFLADYCQTIDPESPLYRKLLELSFLSRQFAK